MTIFVGSSNPVKVNAVKNAAIGTWPELIITGHEVASGISEQPMSDEETKKGALNRAKAALKSGMAATKNSQKNETFLGLGLEGGVFENESGEMWTTVWAVVVNAQNQTWSANGARIQVPELIAELIRNGQEMGPVVQQLTGESNVKQKQGMFGIITKNFVTRTEEYTQIAKIALGLWYGQDWDQDLQKSSH